MAHVNSPFIDQALQLPALQLPPLESRPQHSSSELHAWGCSLCRFDAQQAPTKLKFCAPSGLPQ